MLCSILALTVALSQPVPVVQPGTAPASEPLYIRSHSEDGHVRLETSTRTFKPVEEDGRPTVHLVGVIHVGEKAYYKALQDLLDGQGLILYEAVKPASEGETATTAKSDGARTMVTQKRLRLLAVFLEKQRLATDELPESLDGLAAGLDIQKSRIVKGAMIDAWGTKIRYKVVSDTQGKLSFELTSLGADQAEGGEGPAKDLHFADQRPLTKREIGDKREGMQAKLASAMGLDFQLATVNYERANWRNSDLSIEQVQRRLEQQGDSADALMGMLEGSSLPAKLANVIFGMVKASPTMQANAKLLMIESLAGSGELVGASEGSGPMKGMMKVIIVDRNEEVFRDLARVIREEPQYKSIAIFYGAGHMPDMEQRLTEMGYKFEAAKWFGAIDVDLKAAGITEDQAASVRQMVRRTLEKKSGGKAPEPEQ